MMALCKLPYYKVVDRLLRVSCFSPITRLSLLTFQCEDVVAAWRHMKTDCECRYCMSTHPLPLLQVGSKVSGLVESI